MSKIEIDPENLSFNIMEEKIIEKSLNGLVRSASRKFDLHKIPFYLMIFQHYFMHIGAKVMRTKRISLWKMKRLKEKKYY